MPLKHQEGHGFITQEQDVLEERQILHTIINPVQVRALQQLISLMALMELKIDMIGH